MGAARREAKKLEKVEQKKEEEFAAAVEAARAKAEDEELPPRTKSRRSLLTTLKYVFEQLALLPETLCQSCSQKVVPEDPKMLAQQMKRCCGIKRRKGKSLQVLKDRKNDDLPVRMLCGHWMRLRCLNEALTKPPFNKSCKICGRRLSHPAWDNDVKSLEKQWAQKQAKERELAEMAELFS